MTESNLEGVQATSLNARSDIFGTGLNDDTIIRDEGRPLPVNIGQRISGATPRPNSTGETSVDGLHATPDGLLREDLVSLHNAAEFARPPFLQIAADAALKILDLLTSHSVPRFLLSQWSTGVVSNVATLAVQSIVIVWTSYQNAPDPGIWEEVTSEFVEQVAVILHRILGHMRHQAESGLLSSLPLGNARRLVMEDRRRELLSTLAEIALCHLNLQEISSRPLDKQAKAIAQLKDRRKSSGVLYDEEDDVALSAQEATTDVNEVDSKYTATSRGPDKARTKRGKAGPSYSILKGITSCPEFSSSVNGVFTPSTSAASYPPSPGWHLPYSGPYPYIPVPGVCSPFGGYFPSCELPVQSNSSPSGMYAPFSSPIPMWNHGTRSLPSTSSAPPTDAGSGGGYRGRHT
ncbi:unnamed protein product [Cyclocybe aegerita]|uniref:Uncharacterized protein n=1 Tax=Cyclocybe aegerita TaxID=1973307 RepID=A0A8S0XQI2_CYCAE|nr:unnamed protein product [Cyclocybe aegerita]